MSEERTIDRDQLINQESFPLLLSAKDAQKIGISRAAYYRLTHRMDVPVVVIGERRYIHRDLFFEWLEREVKNS